MDTDAQREDSLRLLALLHRQHRKLRKIYVALAIEERQRVAKEVAGAAREGGADDAA